MLSRRVGAEVDLNEIWRLQRLSDQVVSLIQVLAPDVHGEIIRAAAKSNVSEFAKRPACWDAVQRLHSSLGDSQPASAAGAEAVEIYVEYDGTRIEAEFDPASRAVRILDGALEGEQYKTPSGAAMAVVRRYRPDVDPHRNGWLFWMVSKSGAPLQSIR